MTDVTNTQLTLLRSFNQEMDLNLSIYQPDVALACKVNDPSIAKGARSITFNTVSSGSYLNIQSGMILLVGTSLGASDLGKVRVKNATSSVLTVAENSDVKWANTVYLTVLKLFPVLPIFPRIISDPSNAENTIWYKDYDIPYTDQNYLLGSYVCMGSHRAGMLDESGNCRLYFSASGTSHVNGDSLTYLWEFSGATITGSTAQTPGWVNFTGSGQFVEKLTVTSSGGSVDTSYRYVSIYPNNYRQIKDWSISSGQGSRTAGGYVFTLTLRSAVNSGISIYDGAPIVLYGKSYYNGTQADIGGAENNSQTFFVGYILNGSIKWDYQTSSVEFQVGSVTELMKLVNGFSISVESSPAPTTWYQIYLNNVKKSVYHFFRWHSTLMLTNDVVFAANDYPIQFFDTNRESMYEAIQNVLKSTLFGYMVADRQGKIWIETGVEATHNAKTVYPAKFTLTNVDWRNEPSTPEVHYNPISYIEMGGIVFDPYSVASSDVASTALLASAPGSAPSTHGKVESPTGLAVASQTHLNEIVGDVFAYKNSKQPTIEMEMKGSYLNLDIAPIEGVQIQILADQTVKNIDISGRYFVDGYRFEYDGSNQILKTIITWHEITEGVPGDTIIIPATPPTAGYIMPTFNIPPFTLPKIILPTLPGTITTPALPNAVAIVVGGYGIYYTGYGTGPFWYSANSSFTPTEKAALIKLEVDMDGIAYTSTTTEVFSLKLGVNSKNKIGSQTFFHLTTPNSGPPYNLEYSLSMGLHYGIKNGLCVIAYRGYPAGLTSTYLLDSSGMLQFMSHPGITIMQDVGISGYQGNWFTATNEGIFYASYLHRWSINFATLENSLAIGGPNYVTQQHAKAADYIYLREGSAYNRTLYAINQNGNNNLGSRGLVGEIDCDPTGIHIMNVLNNALFVSHNYGVTWTNITGNLAHTHIANGQVVNLGDSLKWMITYNDTTLAPGVTLCILLTLDGGNTWIDYMGNLIALGVPVNGTVLAIRAFQETTI